MMKMSRRFVVADAGKVAGTTALSSPVGAHGPVEEFAAAHVRMFQGRSRTSTSAQSVFDSVC